MECAAVDVQLQREYKELAAGSLGDWSIAPGFLERLEYAASDPSPERWAAWVACENVMLTMADVSCISLLLRQLGL